jgi:hypothetical protein
MIEYPYKLTKNTEVLYSLDDVCIIPAVTSMVEHRGTIDVYHVSDRYTNISSGKHLPIFASPMSSTVSLHNYEYYKKFGIIPIIPRTEALNDRIQCMRQGEWIALSLDEFHDMFIGPDPWGYEKAYNNKCRVLVDIANGHMEKLLTYVKESKARAAVEGVDLVLMVGNVANPFTYRELALAGADLVRCAIGTGSLCTTSVHTKCHYPMASLIDKCYAIKEAEGLECQIIADGGINTYDRAIGALALGADYVMIGTAFSKAFESAAPIERDNKLPWFRKWFLPWYYSTLEKASRNNLEHLINLDDKDKRKIIKMAGIHKTIFGMSTRLAQKQIDPNAKQKTSEGCVREVKVEYTLGQWIENFIDYLRSIMSYCDSFTLSDFIGNVEVKLMSQNAYNAYMK